MAKYDIKYSCGHTGRIELYGKTCVREGQIEYLEKYGNCPDCYRKQVEKDMNEFENKNNLPKIVGVSEKQIHYARKLRYELAANGSENIIDEFRSWYPNSGRSIEEIENKAKERPHSELGIGYYCVLVSNASDIIDALR